MRAALQAARARLAKLEEEPRAEDLPPAEARVREAQANLADAEVQMRLIESVTDKRAVREEDIQRRRLAYKAAQARLAEADAQLALLKAGAWAPDLAVAKSEVAQAEAQLKLVETNIERLTTRSPIAGVRSEEHTSELQSRLHLVCRLLLEKKKKNNSTN